MMVPRVCLLSFSSLLMLLVMFEFTFVVVDFLCYLLLLLWVAAIVAVVRCYQGHQRCYDLFLHRINEGDVVGWLLKATLLVVIRLLLVEAINLPSFIVYD